MADPRDDNEPLALGLLPVDPERMANSINFEDIITGVTPDLPLAAFTAPAEVDHLSKVTRWGLYNNNQFGVCGPASMANQRKLVTRYLTGKQVDVSQDDVYDLYRRSGNGRFDPKTGADDNGVIMSTMLSAAVSGGLGGVKPLAFAKVNPRDYSKMRLAIDIFGGVLWGSSLQQAQDQQFKKGETWEYVPGSGNWGGHATMTGRYFDVPDDRADRMWTVTWGKIQDATNSFVNKSLQECWVVVWPELLGTTQFNQGIDRKALQEAYRQVTGRSLVLPEVAPPKPAPTPAPAPVPSPQPPAPAPAPSPAPKDTTQVDEAVQKALADYQTAMVAWARAHADDNPGGTP